MKLTPDWKLFYKLWSIRLGAVGATIVSILVAFPDLALHAWAIMPNDLKSFIPPNYMPLIGVAIFVLSMLAKFVKQPKLEREVKSDEPDNTN